jgi:hypothetical protein
MRNCMCTYDYAFPAWLTAVKGAYGMDWDALCCIAQTRGAPPPDVALDRVWKKD